MAMAMTFVWPIALGRPASASSMPQKIHPVLSHRVPAIVRHGVQAGASSQGSAVTKPEDSRTEGTCREPRAEGACGCSGDARRNEDEFGSDNPWAGTAVGREEFMDALGAGPNSIGRMWTGGERLWNMRDILEGAPDNFVFEDPLDELVM